jgi:PAS domain S-box-containing protein
MGGDLGQRLDDAQHRIDAVTRSPQGSGQHDLAELRETLNELREALGREQRLMDQQFARIERERAQYSAMFQAAPDAIVTTDASGRILRANAAAASLSGRTVSELAGSHVSWIVDREEVEVAALLRRVMVEGRVRSISMRMSGDGRTSPVTVSVCRFDTPQPAFRWDLVEQLPEHREGGAAALLQDELEREEELHHARAAREEFLALISHELKTPIAVISGNAEILARRDRQIGGDERASALSDIRVEAERLQRTVDNLLAMARLERGHLIGSQPVDVAMTVRQAIDHHQVEWPSRQIVMDVPPQTPDVDASPAYVSQVLRNLLANAEQHSPASAPIDVVVVTAGGGVAVSVLDRGPGVDNAEIARLFTPFYRATSVRPTQGVGVGLAVARRLIETQRGHLWAERREGGGMAFTFWLPCHGADEPGGSLLSSQST